MYVALFLFLFFWHTHPTFPGSLEIGLVRIQLDQPAPGRNLGRQLRQGRGAQQLKDGNIALHLPKGAVPNLDGLEGVHYSQ